MSDKIEIVQFIPDHAIDLLGDEIDTAFCTEVGGVENYVDWSINAANGFAWSGLRKPDGLVLGSGGFYPLWPGVAEGWVILRKIVEKEYRRDAYVEILSYLVVELKKNGFWRVQSAVRTDFPAGVKFAENLGFVREGLLRKYGADGTDRYMYAMILEDL